MKFGKLVKHMPRTNCVKIWSNCVNHLGVIAHYVIVFRRNLLPIFSITVKDNLKISTAHIEEEDKLRAQIIDSQIVWTADEEQHILVIFYI